MVRGISGKRQSLKKLGADFAFKELPPDADISSVVSEEGKHTFGLYLKYRPQMVHSENTWVEN